MGRIGITLGVLGVALLATALMLCLLPGPLADCGSLLAPMYPLRIAARCPGSQDAYFIPAIAAGLVGLGALSAGVVLRPQRHRRRSRS